MRGSPILRTAVVLALLLLAALPLWHLTHSRDAVAVAAQSEPQLSTQTLQLQLKFTHAPRNFQLLHLGKAVWAVPASIKGAVAFQTDLKIPFPREGVDLELKVQWPENTPETAVRLELKTPDGTLTGKTVWGYGTIDEILTFP